MISSWRRVIRTRAPRIHRGCWLVLLLGIPWAAGAQVVRGRVVDSAGAPVPLAQVRVVPQGAAAITDRSGDFILGPLSAGNYSLAIRRFGFNPDTVAVAVPLGDSVLTIRLIPIPVSLGTVTTTALKQDLPRLFDRMREHLGGVEFGADLRKKYDGMATDEILQFDFKLSRYLHYSSAIRHCHPPVVFLDGIQLQVALGGGSTVRLSNYVRLRDIAAIETFTSPDFVHEPFIEDGHFEPGYCGPIVLVWTNGYKAEKWASFKSDSSRRP